MIDRLLFVHFFLANAPYRLMLNGYGADQPIEVEIDVTQTSDATGILLGATLDHEALRELAGFFAANRGVSVTIDGTAVTQVGALAAQILAVAGRTWAADEVMFQVKDPSGAIARSLTQLGLAAALPAIFSLEGQGV